MDIPRDAPIRGQLRVKGFRRVAHGLFVVVKRGLSAEAEWLRDLEAWLEVLPPDAVLTGLTAARLLGWDLPNTPEQEPVFAATACGRRPRRPGLICSRLRRDARPGVVHGLPIDAPEEILLRCARDLGALDMRILLESARRAGHIDEDRLERVLASRRPGVRHLRATWDMSTGRSESAGESVLQAFHEAIDVAYVAQRELYDAEGQLVAQADLFVVGTNRVHEYDGAVHREKATHRADLRREPGLNRAGYVRRGFTLDDLLNHALVTMHEVDRDLGRCHRMGRYRAWTRLIEESMFSATGRERVMNRWHRQMGVVEWSRTAS